MSELRAILRREWRLTSKDSFVLLMSLFAPVLLVVLLGQPLGRLAQQRLAVQSDAADPATLMAPRFAAMFGYYGIGYVTWAYLRESAFGYSLLLDTLPFSPRRLFAGKVAIPWLLVFGSYSGFAIGLVTVHGDYEAQVWWFLLAGALHATIVVSIGVLVVTAIRRTNPTNQFNNILVLLSGSIGGVLVPVSTLQAPLRALARVLPQYWVTRLGDSVLTDQLDGRAAAVLLAFAVVLVAAGITSGRKVTFARLSSI